MGKNISAMPSINPDMQEERKNATFSVEEFQIWWHGGSHKLQQKREIENYLLKDVRLSHSHEYLSYEDVYHESVKQTTEVASKLRALQAKLNPNGNDIWPKLMVDPILEAITPASHPFVTHATMFIDAIMNQGTEEQITRFGIPAKDFRIIGTYAQTEIGHGTNVRGIQTRADYEPHSDEFVLNTPSLESYKIWAGGMGHTCNYALVVAQLYIDKVHKGLQLFVVPIRHAKTHMPLPGVHVGELGKKLGMSGVNQGFLGLKNVRIPRANMLMKNSQVLSNGAFIPSVSDKSTYLTMVYMRCMVSHWAAIFYQKSVTIATRYSVVRRQSPIDPEQGEPKILDHTTQMLKVLPEIANCVIYKVACDHVMALYEQTRNNCSNGNFQTLAEMHIMACILKVMTTTDSVAGIERVRFACGGFGYLAAANFGKYYTEAIASYTYEGENTVLLLQIGRFLMKCWRQLSNGDENLPHSVAYMVKMSKMSKFSSWSDTRNCLLAALQYTATNKIRLAYQSLSRRMAEGKTAGQAFNLTGIEIIQAAELHGRQMIASAMCEGISKLEKSPWTQSLRDVFWNLFDLHLTNNVLRYMGDVLRFIPLKEVEVSDLQRRLELNLERLRPNAVAICDGFDFHDATLNSVLGCYDGNVYQRIFDSTNESPLNRQPVPKSYKTYLRPFLESKL